MITTKQADEIIDAIMERVEMRGIHGDELYPAMCLPQYGQLNVSDRNELIGIIKDIVGE